MACVNLYYTVAAFHYEMVWVQLMSLWPTEIRFIPSDEKVFRIFAVSMLSRRIRRRM